MHRGATLVGSLLLLLACGAPADSAPSAAGRVAAPSAPSAAAPAPADREQAGKLLAAVQVGPEGQRIIGEVLGTTNRYYEASVACRLEQEARAAGFPIYNWDESDVAALALSPEGEELTREIDQILRGG